MHEPRVRIVSEDGNPTKTVVTVDGKPLNGVLSVEWRIREGCLGEAVITLDSVSVDLGLPLSPAITWEVVEETSRVVRNAYTA